MKSRDSVIQEIERHRSKIREYCYKFFRDWDDADDAAGQTILNAVSNRDSLVKGEALPAWLYGIARNTCLYILRETQDCAPLYNDSHLHPSCIAAEVQARLMLNSALSQLPKQYREAIVLCDVEERSLHEAADSLRISYPALKARLHRGHVQLRSILGANFSY